MEAGTIYALIGPNAAGKTTLFNLISGELRPTSGRVVFKGQEITGLPPHRMPHLGLGRSFQRSSLFPKLTVFDNVWVAAYSRATLGTWSLFRRVSNLRQVRERVQCILTEVGLSHKTYDRAGELSHGQQRALEVALTLATSPTLLLLDEPTQGLSPEATQDMVRLIKRLREHYTILLIEHKMHIVFSISDRISVMHFGQLIAAGTPAEIQRNQLVQQAYLGVRR